MYFLQICIETKNRDDRRKIYDSIYKRSYVYTVKPLQCSKSLFELVFIFVHFSQKLLHFDTTEGSRLMRTSLLRISLLRFSTKSINLPYANLCLMLWAIQRSYKRSLNEAFCVLQIYFRISL